MRAQRDPHTGQVVVSEGDRPVLQYNYQTVQPPTGFVESVDAGNRRYARARSDYIHPLYGPDGEILTADWSQDHPHHRGIYWAWPEVDWRGQRGDLHALQIVIARPTANVRLQSGAESARIEAENLWLWEDETPVVREVAVICAYKATAEGRHIDLRFDFQALADDVTVARRGADAYGGLNIRLSPIEDMRLTHHADPAGAEPRRAWSDSLGIRLGGTRSVGLAVFEKTTNPDYPGDYIEYPYLPWFQPTFPAHGTRYVLKKNQTLTLQYRLWIRPDSKTDEAACARQWQAFNGDLTPASVLP
ncbi:MAG: PmoA family protein [Phycisphaerae bacterium]|nr:PmoA family protein [Phycisphaerae bacterium]